MVNARNLSLAALASVIVVAVVGVETYKSGNYKTQVAFHGSLEDKFTIDRGVIFGESSKSCGNLGRATKGDEVACVEVNDTTTQAKVEFNDFVYAARNGEIALFARVEGGLYPIYTDASDNVEMPAGEVEPTFVTGSDGQIKSLEVQGFKLIIDSVVNGAAAQPIDFSEEEEAAGRALLATRGVRGRKAAWWKKTNNWRKKKKKTISCALAIAMMLAWTLTCLAAMIGATFMTAQLYLVIWAFNICLGGATSAQALLGLPPGFTGYLEHCDATNHCEIKRAVGFTC